MIQLNTNNSTLAIFQKHIGSIEEQESKQAQTTDKTLTLGDEVTLEDEVKREHKAFGQGIKNANEMIGALQSSDIALGKIAKEGANLAWLADAYSDASMDGEQREEIAKDAKRIRDSIETIVANAKFMGTDVINNELKTSIGGELISINTDIPSMKSIATLDSNAIDTFNNTISDMRSEVKNALKDISEKLSSQSARESSESAYDFDNFDPALFKKLSGF